MKLYFVSRDTGIESIHAATVALTRDEIRNQLAPSTQPAATQPAIQPTTDETVADVADTSDAAPTTQPTTAPTIAEAGKSDAAPKPDPARWADAVRFEIELVSASDDGDSMPTPSPDGRHLAFQRGVGSLWLKDLKTGEAREVLSGWSASLEAVWSPDSAFIAYVTEDRNYNADIWIIPADASAPAVNVTRHPDNDYAPRFSADGKIMAFLSQRNDNEPDVYVVWLDKAMEAATPAELEQYFKDANAAVRKRTPIKPVSFKIASTQPATQPATRPTSKPSIAADDLEDAYLRVRRITSFRGNEGALLLAPAGDKVYFMASLVGPRSLHVAGIDTPGEPRRLAGTVSPAGISLTGDQIAAVSSSQAAIIKLPAGEVETIAIEDRLLLDRVEQTRLKFIEAARVYATRFYANDMKGRDWAALTQKYLSLAERTRTSHEFDWVGARLLGELNASHTGISSPSTSLPVRQPIGKLGLETKRNDRGIEVVSVLGEGPAGKGPMRLIVGDIITAIEFKPIKPTDTLDDALAGRVGSETVFTVLRANDAAPARQINLLLTPVSSAALSGMIYDDWRISNARKVREMSNGRLGYIHIRGMNQESLDIFERDLYAAADGKDGLIIDVRNNGGGWTADRLLSSIMAPRHAYTIPRGMKNAPTDGYPQDRLFIQRYDLPINMLANERSFSNAEIIAHAFKTLKRGTLVGQPTAGGVISTGATTLLDGTSVRVPFRGWYLPDGTDMENNGAVPDLLVPQTPEAESAGEDAQLQVAVEDLLNRVNRKE
jgi:tricorn protease